MHYGDMDEFGALVHSLGEHIVDYIGKDHLSRLYIYGDESDASAFVEIFLENDTWEEQTRAVDKMIELRQMFLDDVSIDYRFLDADTDAEEAANARRVDFALV